MSAYVCEIRPQHSHHRAEKAVFSTLLLRPHETLRRQRDVCLVLLDCTGCAAVPACAAGFLLTCEHQASHSKNDLSLAELQLLRVASLLAPCHKLTATDVPLPRELETECAPIESQYLFPNRQGGFSELLEVAPCSDV
jgi:hypothetical protein